MTVELSNLGLTHSQFSDLVGAIYDCSLDSTRWEKTLADLTSVFEAQNAIVSLTDVRHDRLLINRSVGIEPYWEERLEEHLPEIMDRLGRALASWPTLDEPFIVSRHCEPEFFQQSPYGRDVLRPQGISDILQHFLIGTPTRFAGFAFSKNERHGLIGPREIELGRLLLPHIRRSVVISDLLDARTLENERLSSALDSIQAAVILVNDRSSILHANRAALNLLEKGDTLRDRSGALQAVTSSASAELQAALARAAQDESEMGPTGTAIRLTPVGALPLMATVLPLKGSPMRTRLSPSAVAAVLVGAPPDERDTAHLMALAYDLSRAETRVLAELLAGKTLADISAELDIALTTTKTHLGNIFQKTGVTRQADVMRLAMQIASPAAPQ